jgi:hypothetical protein
MVDFDADGQLIGITGTIYSMRRGEAQGVRGGVCLPSVHGNFLQKVS